MHNKFKVLFFKPVSVCLWFRIRSWSVEWRWSVEWGSLESGPGRSRGHRGTTSGRLTHLLPGRLSNAARVRVHRAEPPRKFTASQSRARGDGGSSHIMTLIAGHWWVKVLLCCNPWQDKSHDLSLLKTAIIPVYFQMALFFPSPSPSPFLSLHIILKSGTRAGEKKNAADEGQSGSAPPSGHNQELTESSLAVRKNKTKHLLFIQLYLRNTSKAKLWWTTNLMTGFIPSGWQRLSCRSAKHWPIIILDR